MLTGDNGILTKAREAKNNTEESQIKEKINLAYHSALTGGQGSYTKESLEEELEKEFENDYSVDDSDNSNWILTAKGQSVTIPAGKKSISWNLASEIFDATGTAEDKMHIGDYVNYPTYYDNLDISYSNVNRTVESEYKGWRVLGVEGEGDEQYVKIVSAGVPMTYYVGNKGGLNSHSNLYNKFLQTEINSSKSNTFQDCGFKISKTDSAHIDNISDLANLFNNKYTQKNGDFAKVKAISKNEIEKIVGSISGGDTVSSNNGLTNVPCTTGYAPIWLATPSGQGLMYIDYNGILRGMGDATALGIRCVVFLTPNVKYSLSTDSHSTDTEKIWKIN